MKRVMCFLIILLSALYTYSAEPLRAEEVPEEEQVPGEHYAEDPEFTDIFIIGLHQDNYVVSLSQYTKRNSDEISYTVYVVNRPLHSGYLIWFTDYTLAYRFFTLIRLYGDSWDSCVPYSFPYNLGYCDEYFGGTGASDASEFTMYLYYYPDEEGYYGR